MDNGHIDYNGFNQSQPLQQVETQAPVSETIQAVEPTEKKKFPIFVITTIIEAIAIVVLVVALISSGKTPSIADDQSENVAFNASGKVESIGATCKLDDGTLHFDKTNNYFIEKADVSGTLVMDEDGVLEQLETNSEMGNYTIDGTTIHFLPDDTNDYYGTYSSHVLVLDGKEYHCENYD